MRDRTARADPASFSQSRAVAEFTQGGAVNGNVVLCLRDGQDDHHRSHSDALETGRVGHTAGFRMIDGVWRKGASAGRIMEGPPKGYYCILLYRVGRLRIVDIIASESLAASSYEQQNTVFLAIDPAAIPTFALYRTRNPGARACRVRLHFASQLYNRSSSSLRSRAPATPPLSSPHPAQQRISPAYTRTYSERNGSPLAGRSIHGVNFLNRAD